MQTSVLQDFLNLRLLNLGGEDDRLLKLGNACEELAQIYIDEPKVAITPLLTAWHPAGGAEPALIFDGEAAEFPGVKEVFRLLETSHCLSIRIGDVDAN
jgi:hypothetical protein